MKLRNQENASAIDVAALREKLDGRSGPAFWRSLEELAATDQFRRYVEAEFPSEAPRLLDGSSRRHFLKLMGASLALAGVAGCTKQPEEKWYPYVEAPETLVPGEPLHFASAMALGGIGTGLVVESHMGRPIKVEGNPEHPASLGATDSFAQGATLSLYDPDRSDTVLNAGTIRPWSAFAAWLEVRLSALEEGSGKGLRILTGRASSPTLAAQMDAVKKRFPEARWHQFEAVTADNARLGCRVAFGRDLDLRLDLERADVILALDSDFLCQGPGALRYARQFSRRRRPDEDSSGMSRLYAVEPSPTLTGGMADHRLPVRWRVVEELALAVARALGADVREPQGLEEHREWIDAVARDLAAHRGRSLVVVGATQSPAVHLLGPVINQELGNVGETIEYTEPVVAHPELDVASLTDLADSLDAGEVELLVIIGCNPVFDAPADLDMGQRIRKARQRVHLGLYVDETAVLCQWHVPQAHFLEAWGDVRAFDGTVSITQPLIAPLYQGKSAIELVSAMTGEARDGYELVRETWKGRFAEPFDESWRKAVHDGVVPDTRFEAVVPNWMASPASLLPPRREDDGDLELLLLPDPSVYDGRFANNGWLQELPRPITRLTWDNAVWISPADAERFGVANERVVSLTVGERSVALPVWIVPGQAEGTLTVHLGYGRRRAGYVADGAGFDVYPLRTGAAMWRTPVQLRATGRTYALACTQDHHSMEGRDLIRTVTAASLAHRDDHEGGHGEGHADTGFYPDWEYTGYAWGMTIDLSSCTGCNACVISCQAENNIPVVGKDQVGMGREMHWLRIDRYFSGDLASPEMHHQPVPCMHCEQAPCETVCPVAATVHSDEGLNDMVYNRCVGTRYCSNNCPYKVRRFNFFLYNDVESDILKMAANPDVTVRSRGVMEKCTYCVQRISRGRIAAKREGREIRDGEVVTACQAVCPTEAIRFGDVNDPDSRVSLAKASPRNYSLLAGLGTKPRTTYSSAVRNPNPALEPPAHDGGGNDGGGQHA